MAKIKKIYLGTTLVRPTEWSLSYSYNFTTWSWANMQSDWWVVDWEYSSISVNSSWLNANSSNDRSIFFSRPFSLPSWTKTIKINCKSQAPVGSWYGIHYFGIRQTRTYSWSGSSYNEVNDWICQYAQSDNTNSGYNNSWVNNSGIGRIAEWSKTSTWTSSDTLDVEVYYNLVNKTGYGKAINSSSTVLYNTSFTLTDAWIATVQWLNQTMYLICKFRNWTNMNKYFKSISYEITWG